MEEDTGLNSLSSDDEVTACRYKRPDSEHVIHEARELQMMFHTFCEEEKINIENVETRLVSLIDCIERVDKRKYYFMIYHRDANPKKAMRISELKEMGLYCYWILKLRPFWITGGRDTDANCINERFVIYLMKCALKIHSIPIDSLEGKYKKELLYSLRYRDFTKETFLLLLDQYSSSYK